MGHVETELVRLSHHSMRLRAALTVLRRHPGRFITDELARTIARLVKDVQLRLGEPVQPLVRWPDGLQPRNFDEAQRYLQRPELFDTENYWAMLHHADWGKPRTTHISAELKAFAERLVKLGAERRVPLFVERMWVSPADQASAYVRGVSADPPERCPYCYGKAVLIGHAAETEWPSACLAWLNVLADLASAEMACAVGYQPDRPAEFVIADADGVLPVFDGNFPDPMRGDEGDRAGRWYSGGEWEAHPDDEKFTIELTDEASPYVMPALFGERPP